MRPTSTPPAAPAPPDAAEQHDGLRRFRPEIEGLRTLAILLVVVFHVWLGRVSGGVDVFLFISAFLLTWSFTRKLEAGEPLGFRQVSRYWTHVFRRILPLAVLTVLGVLLATRLWYPASRWHEIMGESLAVVTYTSNWFSAATGVDYYATDASLASPLRHFWSLSVQGQVFLLWPLLIALGGLWARRRGWSVRPALALIFGLVFAGSLGFSVYYTAADQQAAYFSTVARLWEFALGSLVALALPSLRLPARLRVAMGWAGVAAIVLCGLVLEIEGAFPGYAALMPTAAAAMVVIAGDTRSRLGIDRLLASRPMVYLGGRSYALYLVHWPILVFYLLFDGGERAGPLAGLAIIAVSLLLSLVLTSQVDARLRRWRWPEARRLRALAVCGACGFLVLGTVGAWQGRIAYMTDAYVAKNAETRNPGATVLSGESMEPAASTRDAEGEATGASLPYASARSTDWSMETRPCSEDGLETYGLEEDECAHPVSDPEPTQRVLAVGNSHTEHWLSALIATAEERGWDLVVVVRHGCHFTTPEDNASDAECAGWVPRAEEFVMGYGADVVFMQGTTSAFVRDRPEGEYIRPGTEEMVQQVAATGSDVVAFRDNPRFEVSHEECQRLGRDCDYTSPMLQAENPLDEWVGSGTPGFGTMEMNDLICPDGVCSPTVGNVYTFADKHHLTATFVSTTQEFFDQRLDAALRQAESSRL
ncbi:acyltransferase family protein [Rothia halotolerans]|uniref:acyltransferase family protein n=1 Tax=Rothia halotolerans TaxID=405770 RepID=UPI00101C972F|nr:acyltransferase family protein [Rothia halotolerans]